MKMTSLLLTLMLVVGVAVARPAEPDAAVEADSVLVRERRAPEEGERRASEDKQRGSVTGGVHREGGVGTVVQAQGQGNVWTSKDGNSRVDAHGQWSKVVDGPARGKPNYNAGIKFSSSF